MKMDEITKLANLTKNLKIPDMTKFNIPRADHFKVPEFKSPVIDKRTRAERREDFDQELAKIDKVQLENLISFLEGVAEKDADESVEEQFLRESESIKNALIKFSRTIKEFEWFNSEQERQLSLKKEELNVGVGLALCIFGHVE